MFDAVLIENDNNNYRASLKSLDDQALPDGDVSIEVEFSCLNYKDALVITGQAPVVRQFPMVAGIDLAGIVSASRDARFTVGDRVLVTGFGASVTHWGGLSQRARLPGDWLIRLPDSLSTEESMAFGTAGVTAMLAVHAIQRHGVRPGDGSVLVTGAGGGVGGLAIHMLSRLGYEVVASTGRLDQSDYLRHLGASEILDRRTLSEPAKLLGKARWAAAIDNVGSHTLANACAGLISDGIAVSCGNAQGMDFHGSVAPFILRAITLVGINSVDRAMGVRETVWRDLAKLPDRAIIASMTQTIGLSEVLSTVSKFTKGAVLGRLIVDTSR